MRKSSDVLRQQRTQPREDQRLELVLHPVVAAPRHLEVEAVSAVKASPDREAREKLLPGSTPPCGGH